MYMYYTILSVTIYIIIQPEKIQQIYFSVLSFVFGILPDALKQVRTVVAYCHVALTYLSSPNNQLHRSMYMHAESLARKAEPGHYCRH